MQSKTSFFSGTLFKKTITRFMPLWVGYFLIWFFLMPMTIMTTFMSRGEETEDIIAWIYELAVYGGLATAAIAAVLVAMLVYSCFCGSKIASAYTSLPIKREGLFLSCFSAGIAVMLGINLIVGAITAIIASFAWVPFSVVCNWFLVVSLLDIAFFGMATLASALTGNVFGIPIMYIVINFGILCLEALTMVLIYSVSFGISIDGFLTEVITPIIDLADNIRVVYSSNIDKAPFAIDGMSHIWAWAAVGAAMSVGALFLYKHRHMERASDIAATKVVRVAFRVLAAAAGVAGGYLVHFVFFNQADFDMSLAPLGLGIMLFWLCLGLALGWFCGEMFVSKTLKVFTKKGFKRVGIACAALVLVLTAIYIDPLGLEKRLPERQDIVRAEIYSYGESAELLRKENVDSVLAVNRSIIENKALHRESGWGSNLVRFTYFLDDGSYVERAYYIGYESEDSSDFYSLFNSEEAVMSRNTPKEPVTPYNIDYAGIYTYAYAHDGGDSYSNNFELLDNEAFDLWENGIMKDLKAGNLGRMEVFGHGTEMVIMDDLDNYSFDIHVEYSFMVDEAVEYDSEGTPIYRPYNDWHYYSISAECEHTLAWLREHAPEALMIFEEAEG